MALRLCFGQFAPGSLLRDTTKSAFSQNHTTQAKSVVPCDLVVRVPCVRKPTTDACTHVFVNRSQWLRFDRVLNVIAEASEADRICIRMATIPVWKFKLVFVFVSPLLALSRSASFTRFCSLQNTWALASTWLAWNLRGTGDSHHWMRLAQKRFTRGTASLCCRVQRIQRVCAWFLFKHVVLLFAHSMLAMTLLSSIPSLHMLPRLVGPAIVVCSLRQARSASAGRGSKSSKYCVYKRHMLNE